MRPAGGFLRTRAPLVAVAMGAALLGHGLRPRPPASSLEGLATLLGGTAGVTVAPRDVAWEPSGGVLSDLVLGRPLLFLGAPRPGKPRDVYRAWVRVSPDGRPLSVPRWRNLTSTPLGDDTGLHLRGRTAVFATVAFGRVQGVTALALGGVDPADRVEGGLQRALAAVTAWQETGSFAGIGRTDMLIEDAPRAARIVLSPPAVSLDLGAGRMARVDLADRRLRDEEEAPAGVRAVPVRQAPKPPLLWAVDTVRAEVGPAPIAWLEEKVFGARDAFRRTTYSMVAAPQAATLKANTEEVVAKPEPLDAKGLEDRGWPPPNIPSLWQEPRPGEGEWKSVDLPWLAPVAPGAPAPFLETVVHPDPKRPYSRLLVVAMDMRQLELGMEAGFEDPKPLTGPPGSGRLPRDPGVVSRVVATFNGAFKTTHGEYGMMVDERVLLPPVPGAATVVVTRSGEVGLGSWPTSTEIPEDLLSFRQNLDPLVEDGVANPTGRHIWGWQLAGTSVMTERTALCVTSAGHLYYLWANEIDGPTLGKALRQVGCSYGVHLDMNPKHCGFVYTNVEDLGRKRFTLKKASEDMDIAADKFVRWSPKDFFYVLRRDPLPRDASGIRWAADEGTQPPPVGWPGIFAGKLALGGLEVALLSMERGRVHWRVRGGQKEPSVVGGAPRLTELDAADRGRALLAVGLGHGTDSNQPGLAFGSTPSLAFSRTLGTLVARADGRLELLGAGPPPALGEGDAAAQLPLLADDGRLLPRAQERGALRVRGAVCVTGSGRVVVATARHDSSDPLATALLRVGCHRVAELDRGSHHPAALHRVGTATPPLTHYETSTLYALGRPMVPHAFRWLAHGAAPATKPTLLGRGPG